MFLLKKQAGECASGQEKWVRKERTEFGARMNNNSWVSKSCNVRSPLNSLELKG